MQRARFVFTVLLADETTLRPFSLGKIRGARAAS
jgi:hypothetical protein